MAEVDIDALVAEPPVGQVRTRPKVLVGEDDLDVQDAVSELLATARVRVVCAGDGKEMAALLDAGLRPTVIPLDLMMPRVNGHDSLAWRGGVRPDVRRTPVVVCSASAFNQVLVRTQMIAALLVKPTTAQKLLFAILACRADGDRRHTAEGGSGSMSGRFGRCRT